MPESSSAHVNVTCVAPGTSPLIQPATLGSGAIDTLTAGGVLSIFSVTVAIARLPAKSTAVPATTCPRRSVPTVFDGGQNATPDPASVHEKSTFTSVRFQPAAFAPGVAVTLIVGAAL